jgi:D-sedoheptulose 7-phosphate isomerase
MTSGDNVRCYLKELADLANSVGDLLGSGVEELAGDVAEVLEKGGKILFCGNGGSAADAQHLAAEYIVRFRKERRPFPAIALTTDTSVLTACGNDFGFEAVFSRQVEALGAKGDLLFLHSTSGESENLIRAAVAAKSMGIRTVAFLARGGGRLASFVDLPIVIPTRSTARAQEMHLTLGHVICELVENKVVGGET